LIFFSSGISFFFHSDFATDFIIYWQSDIVKLEKTVYFELFCDKIKRYPKEVAK